MMEDGIGDIRLIYIRVWVGEEGVAIIFLVYFKEFLAFVLLCPLFFFVVNRA